MNAKKDSLNEPKYDSAFMHFYLPESSILFHSELQLPFRALNFTHKNSELLFFRPSQNFLSSLEQFHPVDFFSMGWRFRVIFERSVSQKK